MSILKKYKDDAIEYAMPYLTQAGEFIYDKGNILSKGYIHNKKRIKREIRFRKICKIVDFISNIIMLISAVLAFVVIIKGYKDEFKD